MVAIHKQGDEVAVKAPLVGPVQSEWLPPPEHNYSAGLLTWAREYKAAREAKVDGEGIWPLGLFIVGELSEELGTMRGKVATRLNELLFRYARGSI